jgi:hypothetical protein
VPGVRSRGPQKLQSALDLLLFSAIINLIENSIWSAAARCRFSYNPAVNPKAKTVEDQQTSSLKSINYKMQIS